MIMGAPKGNKYAVGNPGGGRPTVYKEEYADLAHKFTLLGATDKELAEHFDVTEETINDWKKKKEDFFLALKSGKAQADAEIAHKLYGRASGARWKEQQAFKVKTGQHTEEIKIVEVERAAPPDTKAIEMWLRNRRFNSWGNTEEKPANQTNIMLNFTDEMLLNMLQRTMEKKQRQIEGTTNGNS